MALNEKLITVGFLICLFMNSSVSFAKEAPVVAVKVKSAEKRLALVIGNGAYQKTSELPNPANDAADMAASLTSLGFEVLSGTNQTKRQMEALIREFGDKLSRQGGVGLFFYAGHGLQVKGSNYLIPVDAEIPAEDEVEYATVNLNFLLNKMDAAKNDLNIVILDACRNNPFARSWRNFRDVGEGGGLAKITPPTGTIMLYATQPGNVASDGTGRNGLFTESLLEQIRKPNLELDAMIKQLARDVSEKSGKKQMPWKEGIVTGDFYFAGGSSGGAQPVSIPTLTSGGNAEDVMWQEVSRLNTQLAADTYLSEYPNGKYAATARLKLKVIEAEETQKKQDLEKQKWEEAGRSNTIEAYQNYLTKYPNGIYKDVADSTIKQLFASAVTNTGTPNNSESSQSGTVSVNILFLNRTSSKVSFYWVNDGEKLYETKQGNSSYSQPTFNGHKWSVKIGEKVVGNYVATTSPLQTVEVVSEVVGNGPIWSQKDAQKVCNDFASTRNKVWTGGWWTTAESTKSVCELFGLKVANTFNSNANSSSLTLEQQCQNAVQGKVAWDKAGNKTWIDGNLRNLCKGTIDPNATISCFQAQIREHNNWERGIKTCRAK